MNSTGPRAPPAIDGQTGGTVPVDAAATDGNGAPQTMAKKSGPARGKQRSFHIGFGDTGGAEQSDVRDTPV